MLGMSEGTKIRELQKKSSRGLVSRKGRENTAEEWEELVAGACLLCSEMAVKQSYKTLGIATDGPDEWAI